MLVAKIQRAKKAVVGTLTQLTTLVVAFAPEASDEYKLIVGAIGTAFTGVLVYLTTNEE